MRKSDVFESKYLKSSDIPEGTFVRVAIREVAIMNLAQEGKPVENRPVVYFVGKDKGMVLNAGNWDILEAAYGDSDDWGNKPALLYITPTHTPAGAPCMGLRISIPKAKPAPKVAAPIKPAPVAAPAAEYAGEPDAAAGEVDETIPF